MRRYPVAVVLSTVFVDLLGFGIVLLAMAAGIVLGRRGVAPTVAGSIVCALASVYMWHHLRLRSRPGDVAGPIPVPAGD